MGSFFHVLQENKSSARPTNWIVFDCEANIAEDDKGEETHTLRLGCLRYRRGERSKTRDRVLDKDFTTPRAFWNHCISACELDRRLVLFGYNVGYDLRLVRAFTCLRRRGYKQTRIYVGGRVVIVGWKKAKHSILAIDACNYFEGRLEAWGERLGLPKSDLDFRTATDDELIPHCWRDVEILDKLLLEWWAFIGKHDLGCFSPTKSSQSFNAYRHRFMPCKIWIHANARASKIERAAYHGGRVECFHIGKLTHGPYYKLDVNSMYPFVMQSEPMPVRFRSIALRLDLPTLRRLVKRYTVCGEFQVETDEAAYAYRLGSDLIYPVGQFTTHLSTPEVLYGLERDHIRKCLRVAIYDRAVLFRKYVQYFYRLRRRYADRGDETFKTMVKYFMLSLYGKFGQWSENWVKNSQPPADGEGEHTMFEGDPPQMAHYVVINGQRWDIKDRKESYNAFPAIAAHVTAAARIYLWTLIHLAGPGHVFYCDTDSVIVTATGRRRLRTYLDESKLGGLKCEYKTSQVEIRAPKDYATDIENKHKGVKSDAEEIRPGVYRQTQWQTLRGAIMAGHADTVHLRPVVKVLARQYHKGTVHSSGSVSPIVLDGC